MPDQDGEEELESEEDAPQAEAIQEEIQEEVQEEVQEEIPLKRGRGRPRKRKYGHSKGGQPASSFALRPVSGRAPSLASNPRGNGRTSISPPRLRTPSPLPNHPYSNDRYWYPGAWRTFIVISLSNSANH